MNWFSLLEFAIVALIVFLRIDTIRRLWNRVFPLQLDYARASALVLIALTLQTDWLDGSRGDGLPVDLAEINNDLRALLAAAVMYGLVYLVIGRSTYHGSK